MLPLVYVELHAFDAVLCGVCGAGGRPWRGEIDDPLRRPGRACMADCLLLLHAACRMVPQAAEEGLGGVVHVPRLITDGFLEVLGTTFLIFGMVLTGQQWIAFDPGRLFHWGPSLCSAASKNTAGNSS